MSIGSGISDDNEAGFLERAGDVVGEVTGGETSSNWGSTSVSGELQDSTLTIGTSRDHTDIGGVVDGCDDTGSEDDLLPRIGPLALRSEFEPNHNVPSLGDIDNVDSVSACLP